MGSTSRAPVEVQDVVPQPEQMHGGPARHKHATAANAAAAAAGAGPAAAAGASGGSNQQQQQQSAHYWYSRAYRALKQRASEPSQLVREYQHVAALDYSLNHSTAVAKSRAAAGRNRYANVLPFDYNRVVLQPPPQPNSSSSTTSTPSDYVNASTVEFSTPSLSQPCSYIATQGPLPGTTADFWGMVLALRCPAVVMLTNVCEAGMVKCCQYFPDTLGGVSRVGVNELKVEQQEPFSPDCTLRTLRVTCTASGATHTLSHYHFHAWPDHGTPDSSSGIRAMCRALAAARASGQPIVVHCSAGIGRTGTFCAIDILLQRLDAWAALNGGGGPDRSEVEDTLDVPSLVHKLRAQRMGMVQTLEQYVFVYKALLDDLASRIKDSSSNGGSISSSGGRSSGSSLGGGSCSSGGNSSGDNAVRSSGRNAVA